MTIQDTSATTIPVSPAAPSSALSVRERAKRKLERDARDIVSALQDPDTVEVMVNADGRIWLEKLGFHVLSPFVEVRIVLHCKPQHVCAAA
jgi:type IV secretion system protein TrbB